jgi:hypothetical protein
MSSRQETRNLTLNYSASTIPTPLAGLSANGFIIQRATKEDFPAKGNEAGVYVEGTTGKVYYWRDGEYHETTVSTDGYVIDGAVLMLKTKTATEWEAENPVLAKGEVGFVSDQNIFKVGDGESAFKDLSILNANSTDIPDWAKQETPSFTIDNVDGLEQNLTKKQADISSLQSLVGEEKVSEQIQGAISDLDLPNTYEPLGAVSELEARTKAELKSTTEPIIVETQAVREIAESKTTMLDVEKKDYATKAQVDEKIQALDYVDKDNSGYFINSISETDGIIKVTHRAISSNDIPIISQSKVNNLPQILEKKQNTIVWENNNYDGLNNKAVTKKDLDEAFKKVSSAIQFKGVVTELPESAQNGDMYIMGSKEYLYVVDDTSARFEELGDQDLYAIKGEISNSDIASNAAISQDKIAGLADSLAEKVNTSSLDTMAYEDKKDYPTHTYLTQVIQGLYVRDTNVKKNFVYAVDQTNGVVEAKKRELDVTDIPALTVNKITGLQSSLDAKVETTDFEAQKTQTTEDISTAKTDVLNTIQEKIDSGEFKGADGKSTYLHLAYANSADGKTDFTPSPLQGKVYEYLGSYSDFSKSMQSGDPSKYRWVQLSTEQAREANETARVAAESKRETDSAAAVNAANTAAANAQNIADTIQAKLDAGEFKGDKGDTGAQGEAGANAYVHIAYANSTDGTDFTLKPESGKIYGYLGQYTDHTETASTTPGNYTWSWFGKQERTEYLSVGQIAQVVRSNTLETIKQLFPVGDQIIMPWKDMDDSAHNTDDTAYQVAWNFVDHRMVTLKDGSSVPGLVIQMHKCSAYGVQFSHQQAFYIATEALQAGAYYITLGSTWGKATAGSYQFTLTKEVPAGGLLSGLEYMADYAPSSWQVKSWATADAASPLETVSVTEGNDGTSLGTMNLATLGDTGLNCMQRVGYGHNCYSTSAIRQYLNATGTDWWKSQEDFDIRPNEYAKNGFMTGFNDDFLSAIKPAKITTALNTVEGYSNATEDTYDTFFLPSLEEMNATPQLSGAEGSYFPYWRSRLGLSGFASWHPSIYDGYKIPAINSNSAQTVRLRSAHRNYSCHTWYVSTGGCIYNYHAYSAFRFSPVCVIC